MPVSEALKYRDEVSLDDAPKLNEEELHAIKQRMEALDKILAEEQKAKYKIELLFGSARVPSRPTPGALSFWESGSKLHGGGDAKLYVCGGKTSGTSDCEAFIPDLSNGYGFLLCPRCKKVWQGDQVTGEILARLSMRGWAELLLRYFSKLEHNADIYIKHARDDVRAVARVEQAKQMGGEKLAHARIGRTKYIYPLKNIIRDTSGGADLLGRFYALLTA
jgi:hypothetical protein